MVVDELDEVDIQTEQHEQMQQLLDDEFDEMVVVD
jgi:hypothetical protein